MLELNNVTVRFGGLTALSAVDLELGPDEILGLIGPNGAGKTTIFNAISRFCGIDGGTISLAGEQLQDLRAHEIAIRGIARTFQTVTLLQDSTVRQNLLLGRHRHVRSSVVYELAGMLPGVRLERDAWQISEDVIEMLQLDGLDRPVSELTFFEKRKVELGRAVVTNPSVLLLDEPTAGMSPLEKTEFGRILGALRDHRSIGQIVVEHDVRFIADICDRSYALDNGIVIASGKPRAVMGNDQVIESYIGSQPAPGGAVT